MQKNFIFSDTETTGLSDKPKSFKKDFIQIIQSGSILTDASFERIDEQNVETASETAKVKPKSSKVVRIKKQNDATEEEKTGRRNNKAQPRQGWWNRDTE